MGLKEKRVNATTVHRIKVLQQRSGKYPFIRVEEDEVETTDKEGAQKTIKNRKEMIADHVTVRLKSGVAPEKVAKQHGLKIRKALLLSDAYLFELRSIHHPRRIQGLMHSMSLAFYEI